MGNKLKAYIKDLQILLEEESEIENIPLLKKELLVEIGFWQHERLIHLLVTILFALLTMSVFVLILFYHTIGVLLLLLAMLSLLVPYIRHYFILENGVQTLYVFYEELTRREHSKDTSEVIMPRLEGVVIKPLKKEKHKQ